MATINETERQVLSVWPEVGQILGISKNKVYRLAAENAFPVHRLGARFVVPRKAFYEWLNGKREGVGE